MSSKLSLEAQFLREVNRCLDSDRNTKRRGLSKLLEALPWETKKVSEKAELLSFLHAHVLKTVLVTLSDGVEKCRELSLKILQKYAEIWSKSTLLTQEDLLLIAQRLCERVNDNPFPESAEELRLCVVQLLQEVIKKYVKLAKHAASEIEENFTEVVESVESEESVAEAVETSSANGRAFFVQHLLSTLARALSDAFPQVKRSSAEAVSLLCRYFPAEVRLHYRPVTRALLLNLSHQHSKTRQLSLHALARVLLTLSVASYRTLLLEENTLTLSFSLLQAITQHSLSDRTPTVRAELAKALSLVLSHRITQCAHTHCALLDADLELVALSLSLCADENDSVCAQARASLTHTLTHWSRERVPLVSEMSVGEENDVENAELELRKRETERDNNHSSTRMDIVEVESEGNKPKTDSSESSAKQSKAFFSTYLPEIYALLIRDVEASWTTERKCRTLSALAELLSLCEEESERVTLPTVHALSIAVRDAESSVRETAERVCLVLGRCVESETWVSVCLSRLREREGENVALWTGTVRVLSAIVRGVRERVERETTCGEGENESLTAEERERVAVHWTHTAERVAHAIARERLLCERDAALREALLLLVRSLTQTFAQALTVSQPLRRSLSLSLLFLCVRLTGESETVALAAKREFARLSRSALSFPSSSSSPSLSSPVEDKGQEKSGGNNKEGEKEREEEEEAIIAQFLSDQFLALLGRILFPQKENETERVWDADTLSTEIVERARLPVWRRDQPGDNTEKDCFIAAFSLLLRMCFTQAWTHWRLVLPVIEAFVQPAAAEKEGSVSANDRHYAAMRGEEVVDAHALFADTRLSLLLLVEELLRRGSAHWESAQALNAAAERLLRVSLAPNLIWRVGRVEATMRKLALSAVYALLRAGSLSKESLLSVAQEVVPLLVSQLDDSENTPRLLSALSLAVVCHRLRGAFSEQAVREMYPKLVARLDDSNDEVRVAICATLTAFLRAAERKEHYSGTTIDYLLEQFFLHLDDVNPSVQEAVLGVILTASLIDREKVLQKAEENRLSHRSPVLCDRVISEIAASADKSYYD